MIGRLFLYGFIGFIGLTAIGASASGDGASRLLGDRPPAYWQGEMRSQIQVARDQAIRAERDRRYRAGEMNLGERTAYEAELERERVERERAAAAAAQAAYLRNLQRSRSGGGSSFGK